MQGSNQSGPAIRGGNGLAAALLFVLLSSLSLAGQINGVAPSVTSIPLSHFLPNPSPSVTSLGPFGFGRGAAGYNVGGAPNIYKFPYHQFPYNRTQSFGRAGYGYGGYYIPYYAPYDASGAGYDYVPGSDLYSGPPAGPEEPTLHIVVEQAPLAHMAAYPPPEAVVPPAPEPVAVQPDVRPVEPTVLVFRDGHRQEVGNYAIMGPMVYVFDDHAKKIALADLDVPATIKANDERGTEFKIPPSTPMKKKDSGLPRQGNPANNPQKPSSIAQAILP